MSEFYVEQQYWKHWPKVLVMCRKNGRDVTHRRYVPEVETGEGMGITEELRSWMNELDESGYNAWFDVWMERLQNIADRIDAEHESACAEAYGNGVESVPIALDESQWVRLPVDADGVPIHIGDVLDPPADCDDYMPLQVVRLTYDGYEKEWYFDGETGSFTGMVGKCMDVAGWTHHRAPTVEDVLYESLKHFGAVEERTPEVEEWLHEQAAKLQLREDA